MNKTHIILGLIILLGLGMEIAPVLSAVCAYDLTVAQGARIDLKGPDFTNPPSTGYNYQWSIVDSSNNPVTPSWYNSYTLQHFIFDAPPAGDYTVKLLVSDVLNSGCINNACVSLHCKPYCCPLYPDNFCDYNVPTGTAYPAHICYNSADSSCVGKGLYFRWYLNGGNIGDNVACVDINWLRNDSPTSGLPGWGDNTLLLQLYRVGTSGLELLQNCGPKTIIKIKTPDNTIDIQPVQEAP